MMKKLVSALLCLTMVCSVCMTIFAAGETQGPIARGAKYVQNVRIYAGVKSSSGVVDHWNDPVQIESFNHQSPYYIDVDRTLQVAHSTSNGLWVEVDYYLGVGTTLNISLRGEKIDTVYAVGFNTYRCFVPFRYGDSVLKFSGWGVLMDVHIKN